MFACDSCWLFVQDRDNKVLICVIGIITNSSLLYLIRRDTRVSLGAYKQLLTIFASKLIIANTTFGIASTVVDDRTTLALLCLFRRAFYNTLMNIHFLYRFWAKTSFDLALLSNTIRILPIVDSFHGIYSLVRNTGRLFLLHTISPIREARERTSSACFSSPGEVQNEATKLLRSEFEKKLGMNIARGWIVMVHWRNGWEDPRLVFTANHVMNLSHPKSEEKTALFILFTDSYELFLTQQARQSAEAATLGTLTYSSIRQTKKLSSTKTNIHLTLLIAVTAQTLVPFIFVSVPYFFCLNFPYFGMSVGILAELSSFLTSCFPAWDAVIVILLIADYRTAVWSMVRKRCGTVAPIKMDQSMMKNTLA
uniref:G protein-coupled receptor n=1 Tax=Pristionchus pacificus TaxID=54126 RepID=A0A4X3P075_PRIPA